MKKIFPLVLSLLATMTLFAQSGEDLMQRDLFSNYGGWQNLTAGYTFDTIGAEPMKSEIAVSGQTVHVVWAGYKNNGNERPEGYGVWYRRSTDNGATWEDAHSLYQRRAEYWDGNSNMMVVDGNNVHIVVPDNKSNENPNTANAMLAYLHSSDGGATFQTTYLDTVAQSYHYYDAAIVRADGNNIVVVAKEYRNNPNALVLFRSTDNGATFDRVELTLPAGVTHLGDLQMIGDKWAVLWSDEWTWEAAVYVTTGDMIGDTQATTVLSPQIDDRHYGVLCKQYGLNGDDYNFHPMMAITGTQTIHVLFHGLRAKGEEEDDPYRALYVRSEDFGQTWGDIQKLEDTRNQHSMLVAKGQNVYAVVGNSYNRWIAYSNDGGNTWQRNTTMCYGSSYGSNYDSPRAYTLVIDPTDPTGSTAWYMGAKWLAVQTKDGFKTLSYSTRLCSNIRSNVPSNRGSQMAPLLAIDGNGINHWLMREFVGTENLETGWDRPVCQLFYRKETPEPAPQNKNMALHIQETKGAVPHNRIVIPQRESLKIDSALSVGFWIRIDSLTISTPIVSVKPNTPQTSGDDQAGGPNNYYSPGWGIGLEYGGAYSEERGAWDETQAYVRGYLCTDKSPDGAGVRMGAWVYYESEGYQIRQSGLWHYVAMTWDGRETKNNVHLYLDGMLMGSADLVGAIESGTNPIVIGPEWGGFGMPSNQDWYMDELQIWTRALSRDEVFALSHHQPVSAKGCIVNYGFDGTLKDLSGHGNDALAQLNCNLEEFEGLQLPNPQMQVTKEWSKRSATFTDLTKDGEAIYWFFDDPSLKMGASNCGTTSRHTQHEYKAPGVCEPVMVARGGNACAPVSQQIIIGGLNKVEPRSAGQANGVRVKIYGGYAWKSDLNVRLHREGQEDIIGAWIKREGYNDSHATASEKLHFANFNLAQAELGAWDVIVGEDTLKSAFTVEPFEQPDVWARVEGWSKMLINTSKNFTIEYGNRANVDAFNVPLFLFVSNHAEVTLGFENPMYSDEMSEEVKKALKDSVGEYRTIDGGEYGALKCYAFIIPRIPANSHNFQTFYVKSAKDIDMFYLISDPWGVYTLDENGNIILAQNEENASSVMRRMRTDEIDDIIDGGGGGYGGFGGGGFGGGSADCMIGYLGWGVLDATMSALPFAGCAWGIGKTAYQGFTDKPGDRWGNLFTNTLGTAFSCVMDFNPLGWGMRATTLASFAFNTAMNIRSVAGCPGGNGGGKGVKAVGSYDPNEMIGPDGYGDDHFIKPAPEMSYTITFENKSTATAPAHEVFILDTLDIQRYDLETFAFSSFGWADTIIRVDGDNMKEFVQDVKLEAKEMIVRVTGKLDAQKGVASWSFITFDKNGKLEEDPDKGFLVPNNANHDGEGFVSFAINHKSDLSSGAKIANEATIIFDANAPIKTNRYINTIDKDIPESKATKVTLKDNKLEVEYTAQDATSGIRAVQVYVSVNKGDFELIEGNSIAYNPEKQYCFATIALDNVGWKENKEPADLTCELTYTPGDQSLDQTTNDQSPTTCKVIRDGQLYLIYNGTMYNVQGAEVR